MGSTSFLVEGKQPTPHKITHKRYTKEISRYAHCPGATEKRKVLSPYTEFNCTKILIILISMQTYLKYARL